MTITSNLHQGRGGLLAIVPTIDTYVATENTIVPTADTYVATENTIVPTVDTYVATENTIVPTADKYVETVTTIVPTAGTYVAAPGKNTPARAEAMPAREEAALIIRGGKQGVY